MFARTNPSGLPGMSSRIVAVVCVAAAGVSSTMAAADEPADAPSSGRLCFSVYKHLPPESSRTGRQVVIVDLATGQYQEMLPGGHNPRVSPDRQQIAYYVYIHQPKSREVWIKELDRNDEPRHLWNASSIVRWVNDGEQLILVDAYETENNRWQYVNWRVNADGSGAEQIELPATTRIVDCTADGERYLVDGVVRRQLHTMPADTRQATLVTKPGSSVFEGRFSPDGNQVAYLTPRKAATVTLINSDGTNPRVIFKAEGLTEPSDVCWSPDGKHLAVVLFDWIDEKRVRHIDHDGNFRILIIDADGKNARPVQLQGMSLDEISGPDWK